MKANYIEGSWDCSTCYVHNNPQTVNCVACGSNKPGFTPAATKESTTGSFSNSVSFGFTQTTVVTTASTINQAKPSISSLHFRPPGAWNCSACYVENKEEDSVCISCKTNKTNTKPSTNSVFSNSFTKFDNSSSFGGALQPITFGEPQSIACAQKTGSFGTSGFTFAFAPKDTSAEDTLIGPNQVFNFGVDTALQGK